MASTAAPSVGKIACSGAAISAMSSYRHSSHFSRSLGGKSESMLDIGSTPGPTLHPFYEKHGREHPQQASEEIEGQMHPCALVGKLRYGHRRGDDGIDHHQKQQADHADELLQAHGHRGNPFAAVHKTIGSWPTAPYCRTRRPRVAQRSLASRGALVHLARHLDGKAVTATELKTSSRIDEHRNRLWLRVWLYCVLILLFALVLVGGATRLTD